MRNPSLSGTRILAALVLCCCAAACSTSNGVSAPDGAGGASTGADDAAGTGTASKTSTATVTATVSASVTGTASLTGTSTAGTRTATTTATASVTGTASLTGTSTAGTRTATVTVTATGKTGTSTALSIEQLTSGSKHHLFGYIGQCLTIPWNASEKYILGMEIDFIDRMPRASDAATIMLVDTQNKNAITHIESTHAWNQQQGTMFYWNPLAAETQFFFNDRDVATGKVFTVLYDVAARKRVKEFRFDDTPIGNGGVAPTGHAFAAINYGRLARLRPVTGYPGALDFSKSSLAPANDGIFLVDIASGNKRLLVSFEQLENLLKSNGKYSAHTGLFINHTLWNRSGNMLYFFVRANWDVGSGTKISVPCTIRADGTDLTYHGKSLGGHPEWGEGDVLIGRSGDKQVVYDVNTKSIVRQLGDPVVFPDPEGDVALSPDGKWFVNGHKSGTNNYYTFYNMADGSWVRSEGLYKGTFSGDIRIDPAPRWNRGGNAILVPGITPENTRQMFVIRMR
jgi:hypothetical protein